MYKGILNFFLLTFLVSKVAADVVATIVDVGAGLCVVAQDEDTHDAFLYDAGNWKNNECLHFIENNLLSNEIGLIVISHPDADHIGNLPGILDSKEARVIVHTGYSRQRVKTWREFNHAVSKAVKKSTSVINLKSLPLSSTSNIFTLGNMKLELLYGLSDWESPYLQENHRRNAISIVVKLTAYGSSMLLTGDTVGRHIGAHLNACEFAERQMVDSSIDLDSDIYVAPHHGADNASSRCFIEGVSPTSVVFSAGHLHKHPTAASARRIREIAGIPLAKMYRTDRGDDEGAREWGYGRIEGCKDPAGDDDVEIRFSPNRQYSIQYSVQSSECDARASTN